MRMSILLIVCFCIVSVQMANLSRHDGPVHYARWAYSFTKVWMRLMVNKHAVPIVRRRWVNYSIMDVIRYQPFLLHCRHVYQHSLASIPNGCFSR